MTSNGGVGFLSDLWTGSITSEKTTVAVLDILHLSEEGNAMRSQYKPHNTLCEEGDALMGNKGFSFQIRPHCWKLT